MLNLPKLDYPERCQNHFFKFVLLLVAPDMDIWRIPYLSKLLEQRDRLVYNGEGEDSEELARAKELIEALCCN